MEELELLKTAVETATGTPIGEKLTTFMVAWYFVRKTIRGEFAAINSSLEKINESVSDLMGAMKDVEAAHEARLEVLEVEVRNIKQREDKQNDTSLRP